MKLSFLWVALATLFLFAVTSVRVEAAAVLPAPEAQYTIEAYTTSCGVNPSIVFQQIGLNGRMIFQPVREYYLSNSGGAVTVGGLSQNLLPTDGSCLTAAVSSTIVGNFTIYARAIGISNEPAIAGDVNDYSVQDILVIGIAFMALCAGWIAGLRT